MKIEDKRSDRTQVAVGTLTDGAAFREGGNLYLTTNEYSLAAFRRVVNLSSGICVSVHRDHLVLPEPTARVVVE